MKIVLLCLNCMITLLPLFYIITYYLQLNRYELIQTIRTSKIKILLAIANHLIIDMVILILDMLIINLVIRLILISIGIVLKVYFVVKYFKNNFTKNRLKITKRVIRSFVVTIIIFIGLTWLIIKLSGVNIVTISFIISYLISFLIVKLYEYLLAKKYIYATKNKLANYPSIKIIGITGSYGKTTTKNFITEILRTKYIVKCTPKSYNTPMGITKYILSENLSNVDILVIEMGAVRKGDISKLCDIVEPDIGVITSIGKQHIDTFKTLENIAKTKLELFDYVTAKNGVLVYNNSKNLSSYFCNYSGKIYTLNVINDKHIDNNCINNDINLNNYNINIKIEKYANNGTLLKYNDMQTMYVGYLSTMLIGKGYMVDIGLSIAIAIEFGIDYLTIEKTVSNLTYIDNRLELKKTPNGASVIFDAYNSNEDSFAEMINVAKNFDAKYKILITPGVVELGKEQYQINKKLSHIASDVFNEMWIINKVNKYALLDGLKNKEKCKSYFYEKLDKSIFERVYQFDKDTLIVFENDLPDTYL